MRLKIILLFIVLLIISLEAGLLIYYGIDRYTENIENFESENIKNIFEYFELSIRNFDELKTMTDYFTKKTEVLSKIILENIHQLKFFTDNFKNNANIDKMLISNYVGKILYNSNFEKSVNIDTIVFQDTIIRNIVFKDTEIYAVYSAPIKYSDKIVGAILVHKRISENFINRFEINNNIKIFRATTTDNQPYFDDTDFFIKIDFSNVYVSKKIKDIDGNILTFTFVRNLNPIKTAMYKTNRYFIKINLIIVGFVFLIGYIIIHLFSKNLKRIAEAADKIAAGEYHIQLKKNAVKEINSVIQSFNKMSSDLKKTQDYIIQQEKLYLAGKLASGMAHELNNPLVAALGYTQMLLESKNLQDQKIQNYLKQIEANILRARTIVKSVRSYSTFTNVMIIDCKIKALIDECIGLTKYHIRSKKIEFQNYIDENFIIKADANILKQVIINIFLNSIDAIDEKKSGIIKIQSHIAKENKTIQIIDNGSGIDEKIISNIFEPFFTTKPEGKGTGLGLFLCYNYMKQINGIIKIENLKSEKNEILGVITHLIFNC